MNGKPKYYFCINSIMRYPDHTEYDIEISKQSNSMDPKGWNLCGGFIARIRTNTEGFAFLIKKFDLKIDLITDSLLGFKEEIKF